MEAGVRRRAGMHAAGCALFTLHFQPDGLTDQTDRRRENAQARFAIGNSL